MTLKQAIEKFEKARKSPDDYKEIGFLDKRGNYRGIHTKSEVEALKDVEVIEYKPFVGRFMNFSISTLRMSKEKTCQAVSIRLDSKQAEEALARK